MTKSSFKPIQVFNAEVKVNKERISQHKLMRESDEEFEPPEVKLLPVLASERSKNNLLRDANKKLYEVRQLQRRDFDKKYLERKKKYREPDASFYRRSGNQWNYDSLSPFRGTTETEGFNLQKQHAPSQIPALDDIMRSNSTLVISDENPKLARLQSQEMA